jgi:protocatechuate 3,4-dioxygenase beta subunit
MTDLRGGVLIACLTAAAASLGAQVGTATLSGVVVSGDSAPVGRAIVMLTADGQPSRSQVTDDDGEFSFAGLLAARYTVTAAKPAYITTAFGAKHPGRQGTPISLATGQTVLDVRIVLPRGAVVTGTIQDMSGAPAPGVRVALVQVLSASLLVAVHQSGAGPVNSTVTTDDRGVYRAYGLMPGTYLVVVAPPSSDGDNAVVMSPSEIDAALHDLQQRGSGLMPPGARSELSTPMTIGLVPTYYPGTPSAGEATTLSLLAGEERSGVDVTQVLVRSARLSGTLTGAESAILASVSVTLSEQWPETLMPFGTGRRFQSPVDGAFTFSGVTPGHYTLTARTGAGPSVPGSGPRSEMPTLWAATEFDVSGEDISGLSLSLRPGFIVSGRVAFETVSLAAPADLTKVRVSLRLCTTPADRPSGDAATAQVRRDGSFALPSVLPGQYVLSASVPGEGPRAWWMKSATAEGHDIADAPFELSGGDVTGTVVTFSDRHTELSGLLQGPSGQPATEYFVIAFAADRAFWVSPSRRVKATRPGIDGRYLFIDLPAADYFIAALTDVEPDEWLASAFLQDLVPSSVRVTVRDGAIVKQDLRIVR